MHVKWMECGTAGKLEPRSLSQPTWIDIESAVLALDGVNNTYLWLWVTSNQSEHQFMGNEKLLEIAVCDGAWWLAGSCDGLSYWELDNAEHDEELSRDSFDSVPLKQRHLCRDLKAVLQAAKYFCEHLQFDPVFRWRKW